MRRGGIVAAAGAILLAAAWVFAAPSTPPLFEGACTNPPTYITVASTPPAQGASKVVPITAGQLPTTELTTNEVDIGGSPEPQAQMLVPNNPFAIPAGTQSVTLRITPVAPPSAQPAGGVIDGNVYRYDVIAGGVPLNPTGLITIVMRATGPGGPARTIEHFNGTTWQTLGKTENIGCSDTYGAAAMALGEFAIVAAGSSPPPPPPPASGGFPVLAVTIAGCGVVGLMVIAGGRSATRGGKRTRR